MASGERGWANRSDYPIEEALDAIYLFALGQKGEPQIVTFGDPIKHFAWMATDEESFRLQGERITVPIRKPMLITEYGDLEQMATDLKQKAAPESDVFLQRTRMLADQGLVVPVENSTHELPRTTAEEEALEMLQESCLSLDAIKEAARKKAQKGSEEDSPRLTILNVETGESKILVLDTAKLIARGALYVSRGVGRLYSENAEAVKTDIELGEFLKDETAELGIDADNFAVSGGGGELLFSDRDRIFPQINISQDFRAAGSEGEYRPLRHSLYRKGRQHRRVDSYGPDDFLDAVQAAIDDWLKHLQIITKKDNTLRLTALAPLETSFHRLRAGVESKGYELGYSLNARPIPAVTNITAVESDGRIERCLATSTGGARLAVEEALLESERWNTPHLKRIGRFVAGKMRQR